MKAIVVYPMNALANSQLGELEKFLQFGYTDGEQPVTFARYTGQESPDERRRILAEPPDILLTNYVMLELVLTRPDERKHLVRAAQGLRFLALDELHTYRGRQGADVAMLVRRLRDQCATDDLQIIGTSATMSSEGTLAERRRCGRESRHPAVRQRGHPGAGDRRDADAGNARRSARDCRAASRGPRRRQRTPPERARRPRRRPAGRLGGDHLRAGRRGRARAG